MSCYMRNLGELFREAGITMNAEVRKAGDVQIRAFLKMPDADCEKVWSVVKPMLNDPKKRAKLVEHIKSTLGA
jgi:hypothetical protein